MPLTQSARSPRQLGSSTPVFARNEKAAMQKRNAGGQEQSSMSLRLQVYCLLIVLTGSLPANAQDDERSLRKAAAGRFLMGVSVNQSDLEDDASRSLLLRQFNVITPENCMKPQSLQPKEGEFHFGQSDLLVDFAKTNELQVVGHCLLWAKDDRTSQWMMINEDRPVERDVLLKRIEDHIEKVVTRYAEHVSMWDVVNEAINDSGEKLYRDSVYTRLTGDEFIELAFRTARKHDPSALLIYNDYDCHRPHKREKLIRFLTEMKQRNIPIDAYGIQGHLSLGDDSVDQLRITFDQLRKIGMKVVITELDIDVVGRDAWWADQGSQRERLRHYNPYPDACPDELLQKQSEQYAALFRLFVENSDIIERVSFWNLHDGRSWLNDFPWRRTNYPLLFDRGRNPKPAYDAVLKTFEAASNN